MWSLEYQCKTEPVNLFKIPPADAINHDDKVLRRHLRISSRCIEQINTAIHWFDLHLLPLSPASITEAPPAQLPNQFHLIITLMTQHHQQQFTGFWALFKSKPEVETHRCTRKGAIGWGFGEEIRGYDKRFSFGDHMGLIKCRRIMEMEVFADWVKRVKRGSKKRKNEKTCSSETETVEENDKQKTRVKDSSYWLARWDFIPNAMTSFPDATLGKSLFLLALSFFVVKIILALNK